MHGAVPMLALPAQLPTKRSPIHEQAAKTPPNGTNLSLSPSNYYPETHKSQPVQSPRLHAGTLNRIHMLKSSCSLSSLSVPSSGLVHK